jgi:hypothetical protein
VPIASAHREGHSLEGTRLTMVKVPQQPDAYEFSIRTPVTPPRWEDFDKELDLAWEALVDCLAKVGGSGGCCCCCCCCCVVRRTRPAVLHAPSVQASPRCCLQLGCGTAQALPCLPQ